MGYNLTIGEAKVFSDLAERYTTVNVDTLVLDDAPLNSGEDHSNSCGPSYSTWHRFAHDTGLQSVFYGGQLAPRSEQDWGGSKRIATFVGTYGVDRDGLLVRHPGCVELTQSHLDAFEEARAKWVASPKAEYIVDGVDWGLRRLDWLVWWTRWALENCNYPSMHNT